MHVRLRSAVGQRRGTKAMRAVVATTHARELRLARSPSSHAPATPRPIADDHNPGFVACCQAACGWATLAASATGVRKPTFKRFQPLIATIAA
jgi:hypothetical protein